MYWQSEFIEKKHVSGYFVEQHMHDPHFCTEICSKCLQNVLTKFKSNKSYSNICKKHADILGCRFKRNRGNRIGRLCSLRGRFKQHWLVSTTEAGLRACCWSRSRWDIAFQSLVDCNITNRLRQT